MNSALPLSAGHCNFTLLPFPRLMDRQLDCKCPAVLSPLSALYWPDIDKGEEKESKKGFQILACQIFTFSETAKTPKTQSCPIVKPND